MKTQTDAVALLQKTSAIARSQAATAKFDVTGGIFSSNPTRYLAEGYEANKADDKYKDFKDYEDVGEWAEDAMAWAVAQYGSFTKAAD